MNKKYIRRSVREKKKNDRNHLRKLTFIEKFICQSTKHKKVFFKRELHVYRKNKSNRLKR